MSPVHDYNLANQSGASFRSDLNNALQAILTNNSSASAPSSTASYMFWADTTTGTLKIRNSSNNGWIELLQLDGTLTLEDGTASAVALGFRDELNTGIFSSGANNFDVSIAGTTRLNISATGLNITGTVTDDGATHDGDVTFTGAAANVVFDKSDNALEFADNAKAVFGTGSDLTISHDGSNSIINDAGTGELQLQRAGNTILTLDANGVSITDPDGVAQVSIKGFEANNAKLLLIADEGDDNGDSWVLESQATSNNLNFRNDISGSSVVVWNVSTAGDVTQTGHLDLPDSKQIRLGSSDDLTIEHNGSNSIINDNGTGELLIQRAGDTIIALDDQGFTVTDPSGGATISIQGFEGGNASLRLVADEGDDNGDVWRLQSNASSNNFLIQNNISGSTGNIWLLSTAGDVTQTGHLSLPDSKQIRLGASNDLTIEHDGSDSIINDTATGNLLLKTNGSKVEMQTGGGVALASFVNNGKCELFHAGSSALETNTAGVEVKSASGACELLVTGAEGGAAKIILQADEGDDNADKWQIAAPADNHFGIRHFGTGSYVERLTITSSGNVGIGIDDPSQNLVVRGTGTTILNVTNTDNGTAQLTLGNIGTANLNIKQNGGETIFDIGGSEKMRLSGGGRLMIGSNTQVRSEERLGILVSNSSAMSIKKNGTQANTCLDLQHGRAQGSTQGNMIIFRDNDGTNEGAITTSATTTSFTNNSDYRLKENIVALVDGITRLKQLKPSRFNFIKKPDETIDGFIAHEVSPVVPDAIIGTKDAVVTEELKNSGDAPDEEIGAPIYQQMDKTRLIPLITAALQEAIAKIETLETKVAALEAA